MIAVSWRERLAFVLLVVAAANDVDQITHLILGLHNFSLVNSAVQSAVQDFICCCLRIGCQHFHYPSQGTAV